ncbi:hypothetical protein CERSUDRAFT_99107 [Gelatoporia subvermispora B]|uniref:F-box domain-containing protein n=1 Tax=Ceriporiopsis subvermispora (strain B) TaxID=914234 RepID=M2PB01_CERS8|nr:hypothetical protein CERSUDRAFT_99107 [Gelatoporia subvermispora B]
MAEHGIGIIYPRAANAPADILVETESTVVVLVGILELTRKHARHIRRLKLVVEETEEQEFRLNLPLPMLQTLDLRMVRTLGSGWSHDQDFVPNPAHFPRLRELALENVNSPWEWDSSILTPLTSLELSGYCYKAELTAAQFVSMLSTLRNVTSSKLIRSAWSTDSTDSEEESEQDLDLDLVVSLHALRRLTMLHWPSHIRAVIDSLVIPTQATIHLTFDPVDDTDDSYLVDTIVARVLRCGTSVPIKGNSTAEEETTGDPTQISCCSVSVSSSTIDSESDVEIQCRATCLPQDATDPPPLRIIFAQWEEDTLAPAIRGFCSAVASWRFKCFHYAEAYACDRDREIDTTLFFTRLPEIHLLIIALKDAGNIGFPQLQHLIFTDLSGDVQEFRHSLVEYISRMSSDSVVIQTALSSNEDEEYMELLLDDLTADDHKVMSDAQVVRLSEAQIKKRLDKRQHFGIDVDWSI